MTQPSSSPNRRSLAWVVDEAIRERKTEKVLSAPAQCHEVAAHLPEDFNDALRTMIETAGYAPFHKVAHKETHLQGDLRSPVPWRFYILPKPKCCELLDFLADQAKNNPDSKWSKGWESKVPRLIAGTGALVMVTWLPDPSSQGDQPELTENNIEHLAAASAAVQNLLIAAEARGFHNYWATGGVLREAEVFDYLHIPRAQKLLGAIYVVPPGLPHDEIEPGALRDRRGNSQDWAVWLNGSQ